MKRLSSHIIMLYIVLTLVPLLIIGGFTVTRTYLAEQQEWTDLYEKVLLQQLLNAEKSLAEFDLALAELVVNDFSRLNYIRSVKLESDLYAMTFAEVINTNTSSDNLVLLTYPIVGAQNDRLGQLIIYKDKDAFSSHIIYSVLPKIIFFALLVSFISFLFSRKILAILKKPFQDVHRFTALVASGEFNTPPPKHHKFIEINAIFSSLELMRVKLLTSRNQLQKSEENYSRTYNLTQVCLFVVDVKKCHIVRANRRFTEQIGNITMVNSHHASRLQRFITMLLERQGSQSFEYTISVNGVTKHFQVNYSERIKNEIECSAMDISELVKARESVVMQLQTDALTGIPNRVSFNQFVQQVDNKQHSQFTLMMLDLNGFKGINDNYGHLAGDEVLKATAQRITDYIQAFGHVYRLGGDEFIVSLLGEFSEAKLRQIALDIVTQVEAPIPFNQIQLSVSSSIGISCFDERSGISVGEVFNDADIAMYHAKVNQLPPVFSTELRAA
ncbi:GGDEF domain-containing protein [Shewanella halifaxensis]|uniref:GGDEF domain-containing protein n=1 Tax=Shewanella halifaxensis TaxID=271098 RepID=UPI000D5981E0|nr:GGDEF domain-containing protein [Shewanella halifaxensis]